MSALAEEAAGADEFDDALDELEGAGVAYELLSPEAAKAPAVPRRNCCS